MTFKILCFVFIFKDSYIFEGHRIRAVGIGQERENDTGRVSKKKRDIHLPPADSLPNSQEF